MTARCPITGKGCSWAYTGLKCRCGTCRAWNAEHSATRRRAQGIEKRHTWSADARAKLNNSALWEEAHEAFLADPEYMIRIARDAAEAAELENSRNDVSA